MFSAGGTRARSPSVTPPRAPEPLQDRGTVLATFDNTTLPLTMARELDQRSAFERAVADIAARFAAVDIGDLDDRIVESQRQLCGLLEADRSWLWEPHGDLFTCTHLWSRDDIQSPVPLPDALEAREHLPWLLSQVEAGHIIAVNRIDDVPSAPDRESLRRIGTQSTITVPLSVGSKLIGILSFGTLRQRAHLVRLHAGGAEADCGSDGQRAGAPSGHPGAGLGTGRGAAAARPAGARARADAPRGQVGEAAAAGRRRQRLRPAPDGTGGAGRADAPPPCCCSARPASGKEVFAQAIHELSPRQQRRWSGVNCAAIPASLIESELFGRERGAFTGALSAADRPVRGRRPVDALPRRDRRAAARRPGEAAARAAGARRSSASAARSPIKVDVRIIAATNRNLEQAVARQDVPRGPVLPPQRVPDRRAAAARAGRGHPGAGVDASSTSSRGRSASTIESIVEGRACAALQRYSWPGNVRELRNVIERAVIVATGPNLVIELPQPTAATRRKSLKLVDVEAEHIRSVLESTGGRIRGSGGAAELLGLKPTTLESRMARLGISRSGPAAPHARASSTAGPRTFAVG